MISVTLGSKRGHSLKFILGLEHKVIVWVIQYPAKTILNIYCTFGAYAHRDIAGPKRMKISAIDCNLDNTLRVEMYNITESTPRTSMYFKSYTSSVDIQ